MGRRKLEEKIFKGLMIASLGLVLAVLAGILGVVLYRGISSLSLSMIFKVPEGGYYLGQGGGIADAIVGSLLLAFGGCLLSSLVGLPIALPCSASTWGPDSPA